VRLRPVVVGARVIAPLCVVAALVAGWVGRADASPSARAIPATGLSDGQVITVTASGLDPFTYVEVEECAGTLSAPPRSVSSCEGLTLDGSGSTDRQGNYKNYPTDPTDATRGFTVHVIPDKLVPVSGIRCDETHACVLYVGEQDTDFTRPHAFVTISFATASGGTPSGAPGAVPPAAKRAGTSSSVGLPLVLGGVAVVVVGGWGAVAARRRNGAAAQRR